MSTSTETTVNINIDNSTYVMKPVEMTSIVTLKTIKPYTPYILPFYGYSSKIVVEGLQSDTEFYLMFNCSVRSSKSVNKILSFSDQKYVSFDSPHLVDIANPKDEYRDKFPEKTLHLTRYYISIFFTSFSNYIDLPVDIKVINHYYNLEYPNGVLLFSY